MPIEKHRVAEDFSRAALEYDAYACLQHVLMIDACLMAGEYFAPEARLLDIGCGTGGFASHVRDYNKQWHITGMDLAYGMAQKAKRHGPTLVANAEVLPFADSAFDGVFSGLCLQWVGDKASAFTEMARVTKTGGRAVITSFGARTLHELNAAMTAVGMPNSVMDMPPLSEYSALAKASGWKVISGQQSITVEHVMCVEQVMQQLRRIGATNKHKNRPRHLFGVRRFANMIAEYEKATTALGIPVTWDVISLVLEK